MNTHVTCSVCIFTGLYKRFDINFKVKSQD